MGHTVLIVEDEPHIVESLSFLLEQRGCAVQAVVDGEAAMTALSSGARPDIVILDLMIPKVNGFEILKWVRDDRVLRDLPILMLTAKGQEQDRKTATDLGVDVFITKPFSNAEVVAAVKRLVAGSEP